MTKTTVKMKLGIRGINTIKIKRSISKMTGKYGGL